MHEGVLRIAGTPNAAPLGFSERVVGWWRVDERCYRKVESGLLSSINVRRRYSR